MKRQSGLQGLSIIIRTLLALTLVFIYSNCGGGSSSHVTPTTKAVIGLSASTMSFGDQLVNSASTPQSVTISNSGDGTLTISNIAFSGAQGTQFQISSGSMPLSISPGGSATVSFTVRPTAEGACSSNLVITSNASNAAPTLALSANGIAGHITVSAPAISFGDQLVNAVGPEQSITITNAGQAALSISSIVVSGNDASEFVVNAGSMPVSLAPAATATVSVTAKPSVEGNRASTLVISSNAINTLPPVGLAVNGIAGHISLSASSINFGDQMVNASSAEQSITISNTGHATLSLSSIVVGGSNPTDFAVSAASMPMSLAPGATVAVSVTAKPSAEGSRASTLVISSDAINTLPPVPLSANGVAPHISLSASSVNFGDQLVNTPSQQQSITISNTGHATLTISSVTASGSNAEEFQVSVGTMPLSVAPGSDVKVSVTVTPSAEGPRSSTLVISSNAMNTLEPVSLSANGMAPHLVASPTTVTFPSQLPNTPSAPSALLVSNSGTAALSVSSIAITGANVSEFAFTGPTLPVTIAPQATMQVEITFSPIAAGTRTAVMQIGYQGGTLDVPLSGLTQVPQQDSRASVTITPDTATRGSSVTVNITGDLTYFLQGATMADFGPGITVDGTNSGPLAVAVQSQTSASIQLQIGNEASPGVRVIRVSTGAHSSAATFVVAAGANEPAMLPVSSAGMEQQTTVGSTVRLDASHSYIRVTPSIDPDLAFKWSFLSTPPNSSATLSDNAAVAPTFTADQPGDYVLQLAATAGTQTTMSAVTISTNGTAPIAEAGPNQVASVGAKIRLDGSGSLAPDNDSLTYHWEFASKPDASSTSLTSADSVYPTFTVDAAGTYLVRLVVNDGNGNKSADFVIVSTDSSSPFANAGPGQKATVGSQVQLDGSKSFDPDGDPLSYSWMFVQRPNGSAAVLADSTVAKPSFTVDLAGTYLLQLVVTDSHGNSSDPATVMVSTNSMAPTAVAGSRQSVTIGSNVTLDGSASTDPQQHALTYFWTLLTKPDNSSAVLANANAAKPSFTADKGGFYVAQLIVSSDTFKSTPSSVLIIADVADLTLDQNAIDFGTVSVGATSATKTLKITSSGTVDLVIQSLSLIGDNAAEFVYTNASLPITLSSGDSTVVNFTFTPTAPGSRSAKLQVNSNAQTQAPQVSLSGTGAAPVFAIDKPSIDFGEQVLNTQGSTTVTISNTGAADLTVSSLAISGANASEFVVTPATPVTIAAGSNVVLTIDFTPTASGVRSAVLTIDHNAAGHPNTVTLAGTGIVPAVSFSPVSLAFPDQSVNTTSQPLTLTVKNTGTGTLTVSAISVTGDNATEFAFTATLPLKIAQNTSMGIPVTFTPRNEGPRSATLTFTDNGTGSPQTVGLGGTATSVGGLKLQPKSVGQNLQSPVYVSLLSAATEDITVQVSSADATQMLLSRNPTQAGTQTVNVTIPRGASSDTAGIYVQALGSSGGVQLSATAPGYSQGTATVTLTPSAIVLKGGGNIGQDFTTGLSKDTSLRIAAYRLASDLSMVEEQAVGGGTNLSLPVTSSVPSVGTIIGSPATIAGGSSYNDALSFHPVAAGDTVLTVAQPAGFTHPASGDHLKATVTGPAITMQPLLVGSNLEVRGLGSLDVAPSSDLHVTVQSSNTAMILLSLDPAQAGNATVDLLVPAGQTILPTFYVQAVASSGTAQISASAPSYTSGSANISITAAGITISGPGGVDGGPFTTTTISPNSALKVSVYRLDALSNTAVIGQLRGGLQLSVTVTTDNPLVGTIAYSPAVLKGGDSSTSGPTFHPTGAGSTVVSAQQPTGFTTPTGKGSVTATVIPPQINLSVLNSNIGKDLQVLGKGSLNVGAPSGGLVVTITSGSPDVLLSASASTVGTTTLQLTVPAGKGNQGVGFPSFYVQGLKATGTATLSASATGWTSGTATVTLTPSGFVLRNPNGVIGGDIGVLLSQGNVTLTVDSYQLDPATLEPNLAEDVRGLVKPLPVYLNSGTPSVGTIPASVSFSGGVGQQPVIFHPLSIGTTVLSVTTPDSFSAPAFGAQLNAVVH